MSLPRPLVRLCVVLLTALTALAAAAGVASAHVTVSSQDAAPGGYGKLTFRVPNESDTASTVRIRIQVPTDTPLASVSTLPVPGWTANVTSAPLDPPATDGHGGDITEAVSVVEFTADAGGGVGPGQFQEFAVSGGPFPDADSLTFPVVQTYSDGSESAWIEPTVEGQPEPESPAPVLSLTDTSTEETAPATEADTDTDAAGHGHGEATNEPAGLALFMAILALLAGIGGVVLGLRANRRTVSS